MCSRRPWIQPLEGDVDMSNRGVQEAFFDRFSEALVDLDYLHPDVPSQVEFETFLKLLSLSSGSNLLEVGCGTGRYTLPLLARGYSVTGIDISQGSLDVLKKSAIDKGLDSRLIVKKSDFSSPVYDGIFDGAFCINLLHHVQNRMTLVENMVRSLKSGGTLLICEPNPLNPLFYLFFLWNRSWSIEKGFLKSTARKLEGLLSVAGIRDITIQRYGMLPTRLYRFAPWVLSANQMLCRIPLFRRCAAFLFLMGKKGIRANG